MAAEGAGPGAKLLREERRGSEFSGSGKMLADAEGVKHFRPPARVAREAVARGMRFASAGPVTTGPKKALAAGRASVYIPPQRGDDLAAKQIASPDAGQVWLTAHRPSDPFRGNGPSSSAAGSNVLSHRSIA
ncbi:MAG: hypothetical protein KDG89_06135, partial [Geminicoccaceae bacterium]|nr:hypothetical protein [Geminicoccaceae bacterium]